MLSPFNDNFPIAFYQIFWFTPTIYNKVFKMTTNANVIILGANSLIAPWLMERLSQTGLKGQCYSRKKKFTDKTGAFTWKELDITTPVNFCPESIVISLLPLWLIPPILPQLQNCQHLIAFSTTSIFSKSKSPNPQERELIKKIKGAEEKIIQASTIGKIPWTILRPTLIYDGQHDQNITAIAKFIQKWRTLPIAGPANGLRQPVHADDVALAVVAAIREPSSYNRSFNLGGGEVLSYRQMVQRVFDSMGKPSMILPLPLKLIIAICRLVELFTTDGPNAAMFIRMNQDLIYDFTDARHTLNFNPRPFQPEFHLG